MRLLLVLPAVVAGGCSDYTLEGKPEDTAPVAPDTDAGSESGDSADSTPPDTDTDPAPPTEECNGVDDDGDGQVDEGFDANGDGVVDCLDKGEEAYCTPFDDFSGWSYTGDGAWYVTDGLLTEGRSGPYAGVAYLYDLGTAEHFLIEVAVGWGGNANDLTGIAWAVDGDNAFIVRWDDPQGYYERHDPTGGMDVSICDSGGCTPLAADESDGLYWPADRSFATWSVEVDGAHVEVVVNGLVVLSAEVPAVFGTGPGVVGVYSNDNDGGVWFDDFCVWIDA